MRQPDDVVTTTRTCATDGCERRVERPLPCIYCEDCCAIQLGEESERRPRFRRQLPRPQEEAELRELLRRAEERAAMYERLAVAHGHVVQAAQAALAAETRTEGLHVPLAAALRQLESERGRVLLDSMPPALRAALTGPSVFETALAAAREVAIVAIQEEPEGTERWQFDFAPDFGSAYEKLRHWNERARREWPGMRFSLEATRLP